MKLNIFKRKKASFSPPGQEINLSGKEYIHTDKKKRIALETGRTRLIVTAGFFLIAFMVIGGRLIELATFDGHGIKRKIHVANTSALRMERADIIDRNGTVLATSLPSVSLYADPGLIYNPEQAAAEIIKVLPELDKATITNRLKQKKNFVYIKRHLTPEQQYQINHLGIPGLDFEEGEKRIYPQGKLLSHIIGGVNVDNQGMAGIELSYEDRLKEENKPVQLSIDIGVQDTARNILLEAIGEFSAVGGACLVMDVNTGEMISLISEPDFNPNITSEYDPEKRFNRATLGVYEMGSIFKLFTAAIALETGTVKLEDSFDATKPMRIARHTISDFRAQNRWLTVPEILVHSSNIGSAKMALLTGTEAQQEYLNKLGFFEKASLELPEKGSPLTPLIWREVNTATISYGYGLAVTPLHVITAAASLANGGLLHPATLIKKTPDSITYETRVFSEETSKTMRKLMRMVVEKGSGKNANVEGYLVGGKTGSAEKLKKGKYVERTLRTSFISVFPMNKPKYAVFLMLDEPKPTKKTYGYSTSGWNAVPTAGKIIEAIAPLLGVTPQYPPKPTNKPDSNLLRAASNQNARKN